MIKTRNYEKFIYPIHLRVGGHRTRNQNPYCIVTETNNALQLWVFCDLKATILAENNLPINSEEVKLISNQNNDWKYQWLWNGGPIDKANLSTFKAQYSGVYQVKVEDKIGCINVFDCSKVCSKHFSQRAFYK